MNPGRLPVEGAGLGLRRALLGPLREYSGPAPDFLEVAPENWIGVGGSLGRKFRYFTERYPLLVHGLSLSLGAPEPLDEGFLKRLRHFLDAHEAVCYSDHLSYCSEHGHLYDLMPLPFLPETVDWVADRIAQVQDHLGRQIAVENISYYASPGAEMSELDFVKAVIERADCKLLLDVNNIHVNSVNHAYDAEEFLAGIPADRVAYIHVAGHHHEAEDLIVDTHGAAVVDPVWNLLASAYRRLGPVPTLLERDFNFPPLEELMAEVDTIRRLQTVAQAA
ncbi:HvfB family MNIO-type RiPP peptide maturase [Wenzhouxiangella marina]|uniref:UPF0276 protein WM2015_579 n=1 Tax=Wenzhouxiangella marina TaxID=1579979 RepID=A0A0K0XTL1_9GAMM|nr:DUF692 domain-containing protein [Wenzhouxiangella marina]AKS40961.1 hypothetical protein WM2015_579 [Wenzhouxiangella marina]MBB6087835.1 hypothetical protein [Wenzhouxiangella marina]